MTLVTDPTPGTAATTHAAARDPLTRCAGCDHTRASHRRQWGPCSVTHETGPGGSRLARPCACDGFVEPEAGR